MNERIREQVRSFVHPDMLDEFENLTAEVDDLWKRLNAEMDKPKAWRLAVRWATAILTLTRTESALLSSVMLIIEESFVETSVEIAEIRRQQDAADQMVYELRRGPGPWPLDPERDAIYQAEVEKAKAKRNEIQLRLGERLRELVRINEPARVARSQIGLSLRALRAFIECRFPQLGRASTYRRMNGPASPDLFKDPLEAFADDWVAKMGRPKRNTMVNTVRHDKRPMRDWEAEKRKHQEMIRQCSIEELC